MQGQYVDIIEIRERSIQGRTSPFICKADDNKDYYVKGKSASVAELIKEWLGAHLGVAFGLPIPPFAIAYAPRELLQLHGESAEKDLGDQPAFASQRIQHTHEINYGLVSKIDADTQRDIALFDAWVQNDDRTLTENGGNPNLLWSDNSLHVIDHNLIFDPNFDIEIFLSTHIFREQLTNITEDLWMRSEYQTKMQNALSVWPMALSSLPTEWYEINEETGLFDPETTYRQLEQDAKGAIWTRLMQ